MYEKEEEEGKQKVEVANVDVQLRRPRTGREQVGDILTGFILQGCFLSYVKLHHAPVAAAGKQFRGDFDEFSKLSLPPGADSELDL